MKSIIVGSILALSFSAFAQEGEAKPVKLTHKQAKAECRKENKDLKGAQLAECIKGKRK